MAIDGKAAPRQQSRQEHAIAVAVRGLAEQAEIGIRDSRSGLGQA